MSSFIFQLGFDWNKTPTQSITPMSFVLLNPAGAVINPKPVSEGRPSAPREPCAEYSFDFGLGEHLTWEVFDLTGDGTGRLLYSVVLHFERWEKGSGRWIPGTPFREGVGSPGENRWHPPSSVGVGPSDLKPTPLSGDPSTNYPYWTPPDPSFVIEPFRGQGRSEDATYRFSAAIVVDEREFQMDPEMIVGPGKSGN